MSAWQQNSRNPNAVQSGESRTTLGSLTRGTLGGVNSPKSSSLFANKATDTPLPPLTTDGVIKETQRIILRFPVRQVAEEQGATQRAVENQRNGESAISLRNMINWCRANPRVRAEFMRLMGCDGETDPDFVQGISLLVNKLVRERTNEARWATPVTVDAEGATPESIDGDDLFGGTP